jgi:hypothetical protein
VQNGCSTIFGGFFSEKAKDDGDIWDVLESIAEVFSK